MMRADVPTEIGITTFMLIQVAFRGYVTAK